MTGTTHAVVAALRGALPLRRHRTPPASKASRRPADFEAVLQRLVGEGPRLFGAPVDAIQRVAQRQSRFTRLLQVRIHAAGRVVPAFIKIYEPSTAYPGQDRRFQRCVRTEYERGMRAVAHVTQGVTIARPLAAFPEDYAIVTAEASGRPLNRLLLERAVLPVGHRTTAVCEALRRVGEWVRSFQAGESLGTSTAAEHRRYLDERLQRLVALKRPSFGARERSAVLETFDGHAARLQPDDLTLLPNHGDLCPSNILVDGQTVTVLDFAISREGVPYSDVAHLAMHLEFAGRRLRSRRATMARFLDALLAGYDPAAGPHAPMFRLMLLQHLMCHLLIMATHARYVRGPLAEWRFGRVVSTCLGIAGVR